MLCSQKCLCLQKIMFAWGCMCGKGRHCTHTKLMLMQKFKKKRRAEHDMDSIGVSIVGKIF